MSIACIQNIFCKDHFWQTICDQTCAKVTLLFHLKNSYTCIQLFICAKLFMVTVYIQNSFLRCFYNGLLLYKADHIYWLNISFIFYIDMICIAVSHELQNN